MGGQRWQVANCPPHESSAVDPTPTSLVQASSQTPVSPGSPSSVDVPFWPPCLFSLLSDLGTLDSPGFSVLGPYAHPLDYFIPF